MTKKMIATLKQFIDKQRKKNAAEATEETSVTYGMALNHLQQSFAHLETLSHTFIDYLRNLDQVRRTFQSRKKMILFLDYYMYRI